MIPFNLLPEERRQSSFPGPGLRRLLRTIGVLSVAGCCWFFFVEIPRAQELQRNLEAEVARLQPESDRSDELSRGNAQLRADRAAREAIEAGRRDLPPHVAAVADAIGSAREVSGTEIVLSRLSWATGPQGPESPIAIEGIAYSSKLGDVELLREEIGKMDVFGAVGAAETNWRSPTGPEADGGWEFRFEIGFRSDEREGDAPPAAAAPPEVEGDAVVEAGAKTEVQS